MNDERGRAPLVLAVDGLSVDFLLPGNRPAHALQDVDLGLRQGEILGVVGESGCGKTTLMLSLMRLLPANGRIVQGSIRLLDTELLELDEGAMADMRWKHIAIIFQGAMNALNPVRTVGSQIAEPMARHNMTTMQAWPPPQADSFPAPRQTHKHLNPVRTLGSQIAESIALHEPMNGHAALDRRVAELLHLVGIHPSRRHDYPHQFSGGMRQRAMIAMALACQPEVIIADEPTTALDVMVQAQTLELILHLREQLGLAVLFVTHDLGVVAEICDRVMVMYAGVVAETGDVDTIYNSPRHPYTQQMLAAFPDIFRPQTRLAAIPGSPPRLDELPPGCRFAPRCSQVFGRCHTAQPPLYAAGKGHDARCFLLEGGAP
jgi:oligopeptide/dipeptide ABC transporter ATP-binding protein